MFTTVNIDKYSQYMYNYVMEILGSQLSDFSASGEYFPGEPMSVDPHPLENQDIPELDETIAGSFSPKASSLTLPFLVELDPVDYVEEGPATPEDLSDHAGDMYLFSGQQLAAFDPNHDEPLPDRAPQLLQRILDNPFAVMPAYSGDTIQEQAYSAFVHNFPLITADVAAQFATDPNFTYGKITGHMDTFGSMYEAHKHLA